MLAAVNSTTNFEGLRKKSNDTPEVQEFRKQVRKQAGKGFRTELGFLGGSAIGLGLINKAAYGKSFKWNTVLNSVFSDASKSVSKGFNNLAAKVKLPEMSGVIEKFGKKLPKGLKNLAEKVKLPNISKAVEKGGNMLSKGLEKLSKTSGRQKLLMGGVALAAAGYELVVAAVNYAHGRNTQKLDDFADNQAKDEIIANQQDKIQKLEDACEFKSIVIQDLDKKLNPEDYQE